MTVMNKELFIEECTVRVNDALNVHLPVETKPPGRLHKAMRYSVFNGGKRIRPLLVYAAGHLFTDSPENFDNAACAVELIHAYSLVHDDLPAMDDDDLRRGKPTCHKAFDDATAIIAGDAMQTLAFEILTRAQQLSAEQKVKLISCLTDASGSLGMCGGQSLDMAAENKAISELELKQIHQLKTGALIKASVLMGAISADCQDASVMEKLEQFANCIGLAFQVQDDILDVETSTESLGKPQGSDLEKNKATYVSLLGIDGAKEKLRDLNETAFAILNDLGDRALHLKVLTEFLVKRLN